MNRLKTRNDWLNEIRGERSILQAGRRAAIGCEKHEGLLSGHFSRWYNRLNCR